jgi:hypothetical protein
MQSVGGNGYMLSQAINNKLDQFASVNKPIMTASPNQKTSELDEFLDQRGNSNQLEDKNFLHNELIHKKTINNSRRGRLLVS